MSLFEKYNLENLVVRFIDDNKRLRFLILTFNLTAIISFIFFIIKYLIDGYYDKIPVLLFFFVLTIANVVLFIKKNTYKFSAHFTTISFLFYELALFVFVPMNGYVTYWFYLYPPVSILLTGDKSGKYYNGLFILSVAIIYIFLKKIIPNEFQNSYTNEQMLRIFFTYTILFLMLLFFEISRRKLYSYLQESKKKLEQHNEELIAAEEELRETNEELKITNVRLEEEKQWLDRFLKNLGDGFVIMDINGNFKYVNHTASEIYGLAADKLINRNFKEFFDTENIKKINKKIQSVLKGNTVKLEVKAQNKQGKEIELLATLYPEYNINEEITGIVALFKDISELKKYQRQIELQLQQMNILLENLPAYVFFKDKNLKYILVSKSYAAFFGVNPEDMIGKTYSELFGEKEGRLIDELDLEILKTGKTVLNKIIETQVDKQLRWLLMSKVPYYDYNNNPAGIIGIIQDITETIKKEREILRLNAELKKFFTAIKYSPTGIIITNDKGFAEYINYTFTKLTGYTLTELQEIYKNPEILRNIQDSFLAEIFMNIKNGFLYNGQIKFFNKKNNAVKYLNISFNSVSDDKGRIVNYIGIINDITELEIEKQRVEKLNNKLTEIYGKLQESINYAVHIQFSLLEDHELFDKYFPEYFILFNPKDFISGDFYFIKEVSDFLILAVADCTGHGVPGALISIMGYSLLNEAILNRDINKLEPADILTELKNKVKKLFKVFHGGMDIALCFFDKNKKFLKYSGAYLPVFIIRKGELIELKATRNPIGFYPIDKKFENKYFELKEGDKIYLFSDGFIDQLGYVNQMQKRYTKNKFKELLIKINEQNMEEQKLMLLEELDTWSNGVDQTDDITVVGLKI